MSIRLPKSLQIASAYTWHALAVLVFVFGKNAQWVQDLYTDRVFKWFTYGLRGVIGHIPFAIGEWLYIILLIILIYNILHFLFKIKSKIKKGLMMGRMFYKTTRVLAMLYVFFQMIWGLNYQKTSPAQDFELKVPLSYTESQVDSLSLVYISQLNAVRTQILDTQIDQLTLDSLIEQSKYAYLVGARAYPFLTYLHPNIKKAYFPSLGDKIGYLAFYQPLSSEAIIRPDLPILTQAFTICHEMAHQLGYASEAEANFVAYRTALLNDNVFIQYSMYLQMFTYAQEAQLMLIAKSGNYNRWEVVVKRNKALLSPKVIADRQKIKAFFKARQNKRLPGSEKMYDQFLIWNQQSKGIESYNDVLLWVLATPQRN
ncbi:MAG: DUF3810 family protein [Bacteroidetes bacterium]|nr:DUF3810 family protein [Bacteroidota bacterium]